MLFRSESQYSKTPGQTFSATSAAGYAGITAAIKAFVEVSDALTPADRSAVLAAIAGSVSYDSVYHDLGGFMKRMNDSAGLPTAVRNAAAGVQSALATAVTAKSADDRNSSGLSIFIPAEVTANNLATYRADAAAFCAATGWDTFLEWLGPTVSPSSWRPPA